MVIYIIHNKKSNTRKHVMLQIQFLFRFRTIFSGIQEAILKSFLAIFNVITEEGGELM